MKKSLNNINSARSTRPPSLTIEKGLAVEIGPNHDPLTFQKAFLNVQILDHSMGEDIIKKYRFHKDAY